MEDKMESEQSFSGESSSSSETTSDSSDGDEEAMEPVRILGHTMELPQELCEDYSVFKEFFSMKTWEALDDEQQKQLKTYLPKFTENEEEETEKTIKMLFNHEPFHFTSPLSNFHSHLRQGNYRPDIAKMRKFLMKARAKQQKHKVKSYYARLLPEVLLSRERLIAAASAAPPGLVPHLPHLPPKPARKNKRKPLFLRAKQRYFEELAAIYSEVGANGSDDENYPDGAPEPSARKRKHMTIGQSLEGGVLGTLGLSDTHPTAISCLKKILSSHRSRRQYRETHPELNIAGITLDDIKQRVALVNGTKKLMFGGQKTEGPTQKLKRGPKKDSGKGKTLENKNVVKKGKEEPSDNLDNKPLLPNIKIKCEQEESDSESSSFVDPVASPKHHKKLLDHADIKQEVVDLKYPSLPNVNYSESKLENIIKQEPPDPALNSRLVQPVPIKLEDLDGIDMMALPVELADDSGDVIPVDTSGEPSDDQLVDADESLTETTHANFLSLVRALFPARAAHRASKQQLHSRCSAVMKSPIAPLNTWYNASDDWCSELDSALDFLAGERGPHPDDFVPYLQFLPETQMYQWIGAGRDCDAILGRLCERWLRAVSPGPPVSEPPPPRYPTSFVMRAPTSTEVTEFRAQERKRFSTAAKPFTYFQHGYRSVVGPLARASAACGAAGALLAAERPRHASFVALVRDAVARLPNGEGTRHDVLTLLKMSQWIGTCNDQALLGALSSALDRLHSAKRDPVVKYDQRTAVWTYLHRNRTEEDWVKTGRGRGGKTAAAAAAAAASAPAAPTPPAGPEPPAPPQPQRAKEPQLPAPQPAMELEVGSVEEIVENASDSDVDVEDTSAPMPTSSQLSSAQLLMQATQASQPKLPSAKAKGKLVPTQPPKPKPAVQVKPPTKPTLMTQSVKQANLLSQAAKQATLMSQAVKQANLLQSAKAHLVKPPVQTKPVPTKQVPVLQTKQTVQPQKPAVLTQKPMVSPSQLRTTVTPQKATVAPPKQTVTQAKQTTPKQGNVVQRQVTVAKPAQSPKQMSVVQAKPVIQGIKQVAKGGVIATSQASAGKALPTVVTPTNKSPLIKQRPLQRETSQLTTVSIPTPPTQAATPVQPTVTLVTQQNQNKLVPGTRSLLLRPPGAPGAVSAPAASPTSQAVVASRRGVVRVLSPATPSSGKSLISPRALMQQGATAAAAVKKRISVPSPTPVSTVVHTAASVTTVVSSTPTIVTPSAATRTVQLAGGRTVQLAANQTVHLPGGQAVQLTSGHTLQLSSLQLPTHSVRLPSGQTVQLASPHTMQAVRAVSSPKNPCPRAVQATPIIKNVQTSQSTVIPVSTVQLSGQTVQIGGQTVQLAGQSVQLTGHTVKLPSGQSVQLASQGVIPSQSLQLPSGQTVQLAGGNMQTMLGGQSVQMPSGQSVQLGSQMVQIAGQTVQLGGQTVQLPSGQTLQLSSGQTVQLSSGQTLQLASGQTVQLGGQQTQKALAQVVRAQPGDKPAQPIVAKLLTNAQGQMISLEGVVGGGGARALTQLAGAGRARGAVRVLKHNIILQQGDGNTIRVTSASTGATPSQTIVLSNLGAQAVTTSTTTTPVLKLQQASPVTAAATVPTSSGVRSVLMDGQQLKLVGGRHVLARILRPAQPPP